MSDILGIREGDTVTLVDNDDKEFPVVVGGICENYVNHHIYMTSACYKRVFGEKPVNNLLMAKMTDLRPEETAERVSGFKGVLTFSRITETREHFSESMKSLDVVVWIIIGAAAALAFLVLFNLTNINVTERLRELGGRLISGVQDISSTIQNLADQAGIKTKDGGNNA